jgi:hypothetical protein
MNRAQRRQLVREAAKVAPVLAKSCLDYNSVPLAVAALTRAIQTYLVSGVPSDPTVIQLSATELADFPTVPDHIEGARHWLAVGLAVDGKVAWKTASIAFPDIDDPWQQKLCAIRMMAERLQPELEHVL